MLTETLDHLPAAQARLKGISPVLRRIEAEYCEMPGLKLTEAQAQRLWGLDANTSRFVLAALTERRFLKRTRAGTYIRASI
jgi:hypothetical protein